MRVAVGMIVAGVVAAVVGGIVMWRAAAAREEAAMSDAFTTAVSSGAANGQAAIDAAESIGSVGMAVLAFGAVLFIVGLSVVAARSSR